MAKDNLEPGNKAFMRDLRRAFTAQQQFTLQEAFRTLDARNPGKYGKDAAVFGSYMARAVGSGGVKHTATWYQLVPVNQIDHSVSGDEQRRRAEQRAEEAAERARQLAHTITVGDAERMVASARHEEQRRFAEERRHFEEEIAELRGMLSVVQNPTRTPLSLAGLSQKDHVRVAVARSLVATGGFDWVGFDVWLPYLERHLGWVGHSNHAIARALQGMLPFGEIERRGEPGAYQFRIGQVQGLALFGVRVVKKEEAPLPPLDTMGMICPLPGVPAHLNTHEALVEFFLSRKPGDGPIFIRG